LKFGSVKGVMLCFSSLRAVGEAILVFIHQADYFGLPKQAS